MTVELAAASEDRQPDFLALWDFRDPSGTEARFRALLDVRLARRGKD